MEFNQGISSLLENEKDLLVISDSTDEVVLPEIPKTCTYGKRFTEVDIDGRLCYSRYRTIADRSRGAPIPEPDGRLRGSGASHPALFALPLLVRLLRLTLSHKLMFALTVQLLIPMLCHVSCISLKFSRR